MPRPKPKKPLRPIYPSAAIEIYYRKKLIDLIEEMHRSVGYWIKQVYKRERPEIIKLAQDASPASLMQQVMRRLSRRWTKRFNDLAPKLARYFATETSKRNDTALKNSLKKSGIAVEFRKTRAVNDVLQAAVHENVSLIKSIPQQYLTQVEGMVMRSVQAGRDLESLNKDLLKHFNITRRRARLISKDQNNKLTAVIQRARQLELGVEEAIWVHSGGGKHPRPTHVKAGAGQVKYSIKDGWYDPAIKKNIWPGTEINCRCVGKPIVPGFS